MRRNKSISILIFFLNFNCLTPLSAQSDSHSLNLILEKIFNAAGGRISWENVNSRINYYEKTHSSNMLNVNNLFSKLNHSNGIKLYRKFSNEIHCDRFITLSKTIDTDTFTTCYNGDKYWSHSSNSKPFVYESFADTYSKFVNCGYPSWLLRADSITYSDSLSLSMGLHEALEVHIAGTTLVFIFNSESFLLEKYYRKDRATTITYFKDYRVVQGMNIPFLEETYQNGGLSIRVMLQKVKFNDPLDSIYFKFPDSPPYNILAKPLEIETF